MNRLMDYLFSDVKSTNCGTVGMEVETQFFTKDGKPISVETSQKMFLDLVESGNWRVKSRKGKLLTGIEDGKGNTFSYELGRHNIELSGTVLKPGQVIKNTQECMNQMYKAGVTCGAFPMFAPVWEKEEDLLVIPDERDATWLELDGREALAPLARTSSVQFTVSVSSVGAIWRLNNLAAFVEYFLLDYPQEAIWRTYIAESKAGYKPDRYGGPLWFDSREDYCQKLLNQEVVVGPKLVEFDKAGEVDIPLFLRSIWWYFRLKRYGDSLCIEVRPMPRRDDSTFDGYLKDVLAILK